MKDQKLVINGVEYAPVSSITPIEGTPVGLLCIVRSRDSGVWFGLVAAKEGRDATLLQARRLWYWKAKKGFTLSSVALYGLAEGKLPAPVPVVYLTETCEFTPVSEEAAANLMSWEAHNE